MGKAVDSTSASQMAKHFRHDGCVFTMPVVSLNIPQGVLFIGADKRLKNNRCFPE